MSYRNWVTFFCLLAVLFLLGCTTDSGEVVVTRLDASGELFSPGCVKFKVDFPAGFKILNAQVVRLDYDLNSVDTVGATVEKADFGFYYGTTDTVEFYSPYVKLLLQVYGNSGSQQMDFEYYMDFVRQNSGKLFIRGTEVQLSLAKAMATERVERFLKEGVPFNDAIDSAHQIFGSVFKEYNTVHDDIRFLCRYVRYDSLFYHDLKELRRVLATADQIPDSIRIRAADFYMDIADTLVRTDNYNLWYLYSPALNSMADAFGLDSCVQDSIVLQDTIRDSLSRYMDEPVVCAYSVGRYAWRTLTDMEKSIGYCGRQSVYGIYEEQLYSCNIMNHAWEVSSDTIKYGRILMNELVSSKYGICGVEVPRERLRYYGDSLYICSWSKEGLGNIWTTGPAEYDDYYGKGINGWGEMHYVTDLSKDEALADARAALENGNCDSSRAGENALVDGQYFLCDNQYWNVVDVIDYNLGFCNEDRDGSKGVIHYADSNDYRICDGNEWIPSTVGAYYEERCDSTNKYEAVEHDGHQYLCTGYEWRVLGESEKVPPTYKEPCDAHFRGNVVSYNDSLYICDGHWRTASRDEVPAPNRDGYFCARDNWWDLVKSEGIVYECYNYVWREASAEKTLEYEFIHSYKGYCDNGLKGTSLLWCDTLKRLYGCMKQADGDSVHLGVYTLNYDGSTELVAGGEFLDDSLYRVEVEGLTYEFCTQSNGFWKRHLFTTKAYEGEAVTANYKYDPYVEGSNIFLHSRRGGDDSVKVRDIADKSESFDAFFADWKLRVQQDRDGETRGDTTGGALAFWSNENSYMDYETAKAFCPEGYHIPDTLEWKTTAKLSLQTLLRGYRNDSPIAENAGARRLYDIFWSSTEKDADTQYCFEHAYDYFDKEVVRRFVECPKDLYPMVQAECVKD
ncbi:hypothetical protein [Fibrobacter sp. UWEL]|uniref:hypothetical protein n=1 Tax=Fibrobacter sp. UWEL TaxID=1896209 RepID=UPI0009224F35|nr:hypothetical protein [Fibrobacter sp. UWEL]SHL35538.1 hypothetical protein SAMN05720468_12335 [Fibrobacter sp. UWEL]